MKITTTRFGELQVNKTDVLTFKEGILGFEQLKKFFVVDPCDSTLILWLQSIEDGAIAFPIIEPKIFKPDYIVKLLPAELISLSLEKIDNALVYSILTIPKDIQQMSANLKAPIVINRETKECRQIVLQDSKLSVKHEMYKQLKQYIVSFSSDDKTRTKVTYSDDNGNANTANNQPKPKAAEANNNAAKESIQ